MISLCASICGADGFVAFADFGRAKSEWLEKFLSLPGGIPAHDTPTRVFARIDPNAFAECFAAWTGDLQAKTGGRIVAIDGKRVRGSFDAATGKAAIHMVSAWASRGGLALGQVKVGGKSNEITAIPRLLSMLDVEGAVAAIDAMGTQKEVARLIQEKGRTTSWPSRTITRRCWPQAPSTGWTAAKSGRGSRPSRWWSASARPAIRRPLAAASA